jgi:hypothetical protein
MSAWTVAAFSVAPSTRPSGCLSRRDVDQHLVHGPLAEPVFRNRRWLRGALSGADGRRNRLNASSI